MKFIPLLAFTVLFASCASKFTTAERESVSTVSIARTTLGKDAYQRPYGGSQAAREAGVAAGTGGGAIGAMAGLLIGESIAATQNSMFQSKNSAHVSTIERNTPREAAKYLFDALGRDLKKDAFFSSRLKSDSPSRISSTVLRYGIMRTGEANGEMGFRMNVVAKIELINGSGKKLAGRQYLGASAVNRTIADYAAHPALIRGDFDTASDSAVDAFLKDITKKAAN